MLRIPRTAGGLLCLAVVAACRAGPEAPAAAPVPATAPPARPAPPPGAAPASRSVRDGVFTAAQAARGARVFEASCTACHTTDDWTEAEFRDRWAGRSVHRLFTQIHETMPHDAPGSLGAQQYADVVAYILSLNRLPPGRAELGTDASGLQVIRIDWGAAR